MRRLVLPLLLVLFASPAFALSEITQSVINAFVPVVRDTLLSLLSALTALGAVIWVARLVYNKFAPEDFPRFDWKFDESFDAGPMYSDNEFGARQRAAARLEQRNDIYQDLRDIEDYYPPLDDH